MFGIDHFGIVVRDLAESVSYYSRLLDSEPIESATWEGERARYLSQIVGYSGEGLRLDAVFFRIPYTNAILELLYYSGFPRPGAITVGSTDIGSSHLGFMVESIGATLSRLDDETQPTPIAFGPYVGGRSVYLRDPNGVIVQLMEVARRPGDLPALRRSQSPS
jgi:catechol 2,3-dioxygenase-like lactoylglutathione lyase family enzyme